MRGNPNPRIDHLNPFPKFCEEGAAKKPVQVKVAKSHYDKWMALPVELRNNLLRQTIAKAIGIEVEEL
ncbi:MAG: hypothetical protein ACRC2R_09830 [Xenococcaceae cyanobacterium]